LAAILAAVAIGIVAVVAGGAFASSGPYIASGQAVYSPGQTVDLYGSGWEPGESVQLAVNDSVGNTWSWSDTVTADSGGSVIDSLTLPSSFVAQYTVTASGTSGEATATFYDDSVTISPATASAKVGDTLSFTSAKSGNGCSVTSGVWSVSPSGDATVVTSSLNGASIKFTSAATVTVSETMNGTNNGGNPCNAASGTTGSSTVTVTPSDTTAPTSVVSSTTPSGYTSGSWTNQNVTLNLSATDNAGGAGVKSITYSASGAQTISSTTVSGSSTSVTINTEGTTTVSFHAADNANNVESPANTFVVKIDKTKPVITATATNADNSAYTADTWTNQSVTVSFSCSDSGSVQSGIDTNTLAGDTLSSNTSNGSVTNTGSCTDKAGNTADPATFSPIKIDKTPPTVNCAAAIPDYLLGGGWYATNQSVSCTASDGLSGLATAGDSSFNLGPTTIESGSYGTQTLGPKDVKDKAGNSTSTGSFPLQIDQQKPVISPTCPTSAVLLNSTASASWTASDGGSGLMTASSGSISLDTSTVGPHTATVPANTAADNVGNKSAAATCNYSVAYRWSGFLQPINDTAHFVGETTSIFKAGSTVPVKFQLTDATGAPVQEGGMGPVWLNPLRGNALPSTATVDETVYSAASTAGGYYRWDPTGLQYIYNWNTSKGQAGYYYRIGVQLDDGNTSYVSIGLR
jgi:hypothetical protein